MSQFVKEIATNLSYFVGTKKVKRFLLDKPSGLVTKWIT